MPNIFARAVPEQPDVPTRLRAAFLALGAPADRVDELGQNVLDKIVKALVINAAIGPGDPAAGRQFRGACHTASVAELDRLTVILDIGPALRVAIAGLHMPAIVALANANNSNDDEARGGGIMRATLERIAAASTQWVAAIERAKQQLPADDPHKPPAQPAGKPRKVHAQHVAGWVITGYRELFGDEAPRGAGGEGLPALVAAIFKITGIKAQPKGAILAARKVLDRADEERASLARSS